MAGGRGTCRVVALCIRGREHEAASLKTVIKYHRETASIGERWMGRFYGALVVLTLVMGCVGEGGETPDTASTAPGECTSACEGRECGDDGCGDTCGTCPAVTPDCNDSGLCESPCEPACSGRECGDDGCLASTSLSASTQFLNALAFRLNAASSKVT